MNVLFVMKGPLYARNFEHLLRELDRRGHRVHVAFEKESKKVPEQWKLIERLCEEHQGITNGWAARRSATRYALLGEYLRLWLDYLRYFHPRYRTAPSLSERARSLMPPSVRRIMGWRLARSRPGVALLTRALDALERATPPAAEVAAFVGERSPDVLAVTPLVRFGTPQADYLRAAHEVGIPTAYCAWSWDNLTTKGMIRGEPDLVTVWNEIQRREAVELHGMDPERVLPVGAATYDHWFDWEPSTSREEFCRAVGLPAERPYLLYLGSALIEGDELPFVERWVRTLRAHPDPALREASVLVRPHPKRQGRAADYEALSGLDRVAVWPSPGASPVRADWRSILFDSVHHSVAVVGLNTSAFIDAAIIGRPSYALLPPEFSGSQGDTLHFHYLTDVSGGVLRTATTFEEHAGQLRTALASGEEGARSRRFIEEFVRPGGLGVPATARLADAVERAAALPVAPRPVSPGRRLAARAVLFPLAERVWHTNPSVRKRRGQARSRALHRARKNSLRVGGLARRRVLDAVGRSTPNGGSRDRAVIPHPERASAGANGTAPEPARAGGGAPPEAHS